MSKISLLTILAFIAFSCNQISDKFETIYFDNGNTQKECKQTGDTINCKHYNEEGSLISEELYINEKLNGISRDFYTDGNLKNVRSYKDGLKNGYWIEFSKGGVPMNEFYFYHGEKRLYKKYYASTSSSNSGVIEYYIPRGKQDKLIGINIYENSYENGYNTDLSTYYHLSIENMYVEKNDSARLKFLFNKNLVDIKILFGEIDTVLNVLTLKPDTLEVNRLVFEYKLQPPEIGVNNIQGLVIARLKTQSETMSNDTIVDVRYPIYEDVIVY